MQKILYLIHPPHSFVDLPLFRRKLRNQTLFQYSTEIFRCLWKDQLLPGQNRVGVHDAVQVTEFLKAVRGTVIAVADICQGIAEFHRVDRLACMGRGLIRQSGYCRFLAAVCDASRNRCRRLCFCLLLCESAFLLRTG